MPGGRPSKYTEKTANAICASLSLGASLRAICRKKGMPSISTVMKWRVENAEFSERYARARENQADYFVDEIIEIADDKLALDPQKTRLRIDARKWVAGKQRPKVYGDKIQQEISGELDIVSQMVSDIGERSKGLPSS